MNGSTAHDRETSPAFPATGFLLPLPAARLLNELIHLGPARVTIEDRGLHLVRPVDFGLFLATGRGRPLNDPVSGLGWRPDHRTVARILPEGTRPSLELRSAGGSRLSIRLQALAWNSRAFLDLVTRLGGIAIEPAPPASAGEPFPAPTSESDGGAQALFAALGRRPVLSATVVTDAATAECAFSPAFIGLVRGVLRITDPGQCHELHLHPGQVRLRWHEAGDTLHLHCRSGLASPLRKPLPATPFPQSLCA